MNLTLASWSLPNSMSPGATRSMSSCSQRSIPTVRHRPVRTFVDGCQELPAIGARAPVCSDRHNAEGAIESPKIIRVGGDGLLKGAASADNDVSIHNIGRPARS